MGETASQRRGYRSLFWPVLLISAGIIILLGNLGVVTSVNIIAVLRMWPLLLILIGLDLLFGRSSPLLGALIGIGAVVLVVVIMLVGPSIGLAGDVSVKEFTDSVALADADAADVTLGLSVGDVRVMTVRNRDNLIEADLTYVGGDVSLRVSGERRKSVVLEQESQNIQLFGPFDFLGTIFDNPQLNWEIRLTDRIPLNLTLNASVGNAVLDLRDLNLTNLRVRASVGELQVNLPATESRYSVDINGGVGNVNVVIPDGADIDMTVNGGTGDFTIDVPANAAVHLDAQTGVGSISAPGLERVTGDAERVVGDRGTWETPGFSEAARRITITFRGGVGNLTVR